MAKVVPMYGFSCFNKSTVGTKVTEKEGFMTVLQAAILEHDPTKDEIKGQHLIECPAAMPFVLAGVGRRSSNPEDYLLRVQRDRVEVYLRREHAAAVESCQVIVYTREAYLVDPEVRGEEKTRIKSSEATHVLIAVLASAGPKAPLSPYRLVSNLAGGNRAALVWTAEEIRTKANEIMAYDKEWAVVADPPPCYVCGGDGWLGTLDMPSPGNELRPCDYCEGRGCMKPCGTCKSMVL